MTTIGPLLLFNADNVWTMAAALTFLGAGVIVLVGTLRRTLFLTRAKLESEVQQWQAESDYWRTMETAIEELAETIGEVDQKSDEREKLLSRLCEEATAVIARLQVLLDEAHAMADKPIKRRSSRATAAATAQQVDEGRDQGRIVKFDRLRAAQNRNHKLVCDLFASGHDLSQISKETGLGIGEIELILNVARTKGGTGTA
jgi:hypothetical protein